MQEYVRDIKLHKTLTREEEVSLFRDMADPGKKKAARARLIESQLGLVVKVAKKYKNRGLELSDLVGEGNVGLVRSVDLFDPSSGNRFSSYAWKAVVNTLKEAFIYRTATVRSTRHVTELRWKWKAASDRLAAFLDHPPTFAEVAEHMGLDDKGRERMAKAIAAVTPRYEELRPDLAVGEDVAGWVDADEAAFLVEKSLRLLTDRNRNIVSMSYGLGGREPMVSHEVGREHGLTGSMVRYVVKESVKLMKASE